MSGFAGVSAWNAASGRSVLSEMAVLLASVSWLLTPHQDHPPPPSAALLDQENWPTPSLLVEFPEARGRAGHTAGAQERFFSLMFPGCWGFFFDVGSALHTPRCECRGGRPSLLDSTC